MRVTPFGIIHSPRELALVGHYALTLPDGSVRRFAILGLEGDGEVDVKVLEIRDVGRRRRNNHIVSVMRGALPYITDAITAGVLVRTGD